MHDATRRKLAQEHHPKVISATPKATEPVASCQPSSGCPQASPFPYDVETAELWIDRAWVTRNDTKTVCPVCDQAVTDRPLSQHACEFFRD